MTGSSQPHGLQHARLPCLSPTPGDCSDSCPLSWWCYPTISSSVITFSSCLQYFPTSGFFQVSQFFASGGQSIGVSATTSVLPTNIQDWFPLGLTLWSLSRPRDSLESSPTLQFKSIKSLMLSFLCVSIVLNYIVHTTVHTWRYVFAYCIIQLMHNLAQHLTFCLCHIQMFCQSDLYELLFKSQELNLGVVGSLQKDSNFFLPTSLPGDFAAFFIKK